MVWLTHKLFIKKLIFGGGEIVITCDTVLEHPACVVVVWVTT